MFRNKTGKAGFYRSEGNEIQDQIKVFGADYLFARNIIFELEGDCCLSQHAHTINWKGFFHCHSLLRQNKGVRIYKTYPMTVVELGIATRLFLERLGYCSTSQITSCGKRYPLTRLNDIALKIRIEK